MASSKYHVDDDVTGSSGAAGAGGLEATPDRTPLEKLVDTFARGDSECAEALLDSCLTPFQDCADSPDCLDFGMCVRETASPAAETTCSDRFGTSSADHWKFEYARHCWANRHAECDLGKNFSCVGVYGPPSGDRPSVTLLQQVRLLNSSLSSDFSVEFCPIASACETPDALITPDSPDGSFEVTLELSGGTFGVGNVWAGYRLVKAQEINPSIIDANVPLWGRRAEITRVLSRDEIERLVQIERDPLHSLFVQVVDCLSDPVPGARVEPEPSGNVDVTYTSESLLSGKVTFSNGAAAVSGFERNNALRLTAKRGSLTISHWTGIPRDGFPYYIRMYPMGAE